MKKIRDGLLFVVWISVLILFYVGLSGCGGQSVEDTHDFEVVDAEAGDLRNGLIPICESYKVFYPRLDIQQELALQYALNYWESAVGQSLFDQRPGEEAVVSPAYINIKVVEKVEVDGFKDPGAVTLWKAGCAWEIQVEEAFAENHRFFTHEIGHVFGFGHADSVESIMYHEVDSTGHITQDMVDTLSSVLEELNK